MFFNCLEYLKFIDAIHFLFLPSCNFPNFKDDYLDIIEDYNDNDQRSRAELFEKIGEMEVDDFDPICIEIVDKLNKFNNLFANIKNLEEMNRSWIRMTLNASTIAINLLVEKRLELNIIISDTIEILSELGGLTIDIYSKVLLPKLIEIIFMYDDSISQEFFIEYIGVNEVEKMLWRAINGLIRWKKMQAAQNSD